MALTVVAASLDPARLLAVDDTAGLESPVAFDIPAQPLTGALEAFSAASGYQILTPFLDVSVPRTGGVKGAFAPRDALARLIVGTGLIARVTGERAVILLPEPQALPPLPSAAEQVYDATLQDSLFGALCGNPLTRPGSYRAALALWVGPAGQVERAELLSSTGNRERDDRILDVFRKTALRSPPPGLAQPITLLITSRASGTGVCPAPVRPGSAMSRAATP